MVDRLRVREGHPGGQAVPRRRFLALSTAAGTAAVLGSAQAAWSSAGDPAGAVTCPGATAHQKRQLRGVWIASITNSNWPSAPGLPAARQRAELTTLLDQVAAMRMNAVYLEIRPAADALYASPYEPWSQYLTGTQGVDPGYDPLEFAVAEAHARNLELHAWMNPYRVSFQSHRGKLVPWHPARLHPDWVVGYRGQLFYNPGVPAVHAFNVKVITDVARRYDVDGIHFDEYFYPYPAGNEQFDDGAAFAAYGGGFASRGDWRRDNVNRLIKELSTAIPAVKPWLKWGISPFGIWRNHSADPRGSGSAGLQSYGAIYADTRSWVRNGWVDYIAPQVYWNIGFPPAAYEALVPWWAAVVAGTDVQLLIGQTVSKIGISQPSGWLNPDEMPDHLIFNRSYPAVAGDIFFNITKLLTDPLGFQNRLSGDLYAHPALVPEMPRHPGLPPDPPRLLTAEPVSGDAAGGVELRWLRPDGRRGVPAAYYAVYRFNGEVEANGCDFADARNLIGTVSAASGRVMTWTDTLAAPGGHYTYHVTALDRLHHESRPSIPRVVPAAREKTVSQHRRTP